MTMSYDELQLGDDWESLFIQETFHRNEPIRSKPVKEFITKVWVKKKPTRTLDDRFTELMCIAEQRGIEHSNDMDDSDDDDYEDIQNGDSLPANDVRHTLANHRKLVTNLAKKLKKKSICNRIGIAYNPSARLKQTRTSLNTTKSWSEKFGKLLAAKKLLYLPLLFRKYHSGPKMSKQELDYEIDLYMSQAAAGLKPRLLRLKTLKDITNIANGLDSMSLNITDNNNDSLANDSISTPNIFGGFGGPGWKKRLGRVSAVSNSEPLDSREQLDMDIDDWMKDATKKKRNNNVNHIHMNSTTNNNNYDTKSVDSFESL